MSKVRKGIRECLLKKKELKSQVQRAIDVFNSSINKEMAKIELEIIELEKQLIKLEK